MRVLFLANCSQAILNHNWFWSYPDPALDNGLEQIIGPFQIENAKDKMNGNEKKLPEKEFPLQFDFLFPQTEKE